MKEIKTKEINQVLEHLEKRPETVTVDVDDENLRISLHSKCVSDKTVESCLDTLHCFYDAISRGHLEKIKLFIGYQEPVRLIGDDLDNYKHYLQRIINEFSYLKKSNILLFLNDDFHFIYELLSVAGYLDNDINDLIKTGME